MSSGRGRGKPASLPPRANGEPTAAAAGPIGIPGGPRVVRDSFKGWRVACPAHGELSSYSRFWPASRDLAQHLGTCQLALELERGRQMEAGCR